MPALTACAAASNTGTSSGTGDTAGFFLGLWQGFISPVTFLVSLFNSNVGIYEVINNGNWYNFGFMIGVSAVFTGLARSGMAARSGNRGPSISASARSGDSRTTGGAASS